ncbi:MAG: hypothetical protein MUC35_01680 [Candidatus Margulisbacteria bacterium]|nr:hypothetical protein [Candidatus Margulisiibacteriota bacterium]
MPTWLLLLWLTVTIINYPNPFNPRAGQVATFECASTATQETRLLIFDRAARLLVQKTFPLDAWPFNRLVWNGYSDGNELVSPGVYLYRLIDPATNRPIGKGKVWVIDR